VTDNQKEYEAMRYLVGERFRRRARDEQGVAGPGEHLDADTVASFIEGCVEEPGASLITSHLITCSQCRTATARTMHLECETEAESDTLPPDQAPGKLRQFLDRLGAQVFPSTEGDVVFAYQDQSLPEDSTEDQVNEEPAVESKENLEK
jgi:hypothetical protein